MICLINTNKIKQCNQIGGIKTTFRKLCNAKVKRKLTASNSQISTQEVLLKMNDFIFKPEYAIKWRIQFIKLICGLSILKDPISPPASYVGLNNPKNMCFAIAPIQCFLRCTKLMKDVVVVPNQQRDIFTKLLFNTLVEIQSAVYTNRLRNLHSDDTEDDIDADEKKKYTYRELPKEYISEESTEGTDAMTEFRDGEPHGKFRLCYLNYFC